MPERMEKILKSIDAPKVEFVQHKRELRDGLLASFNHQQQARSGWLTSWRHGLYRRAAFATLAAVVLVSSFGGSAALADSAKPGDVLYVVDKGFENLRLTVATSEESKLDLKIGFAEERVEEVIALSGGSDTASLQYGIDELDATIDDVDTTLDEARLSLELGKEASLDRSTLDHLSQRFRGVLAAHHSDLASLEVAFDSDESSAKLTRVQQLMQKSASDNGDSSEGFVTVRGQINVAPDADSAATIEVGGQLVDVESAIDLGVFDDRRVEVRGLLANSVLTIQELEFGRIQLRVNPDTDDVELSMTDRLERIDGVYQMSDGEIAMLFDGDLIADENLEDFIGDTLSVRGVLKHDAVLIIHVSGSGIELILEEGAQGDNTEADAVPDVDATSGSDTSKKDASTGEAKSIFLEGVLKKSGDTYTLTQSGVVYTIQSDQDVSGYIGRPVAVTGELFTGRIVKRAKVEARL